MVNLGFFGGVISGIDATFIFWVIAFLVCLGITNYIFTRFFKNQKMVGTSIAVLTSVAIVYFTSRKYPNFLNDIFYSFGMDPDTILQILPWVGLVVAIVIVLVWGFAMLFMVSGAMLIISGATGLTYNQTAAIIIGTILFLLGLWMWWRRKRKLRGGGGKTPKPKRGQSYLKIQINGNGNTNPSPGTYSIKEGKNTTVKAINPGNLSYWLVNGVRYNKSSSISVNMKTNYTVVAVFGKITQPPKPRTDILINEAIQFKKWTHTQKNPKFYQNWAHYLSWLKRKRYGNSEADIMNKLYVTKKDIINVVKRYILIPN